MRRTSSHTAGIRHNVDPRAERAVPGDDAVPFGGPEAGAEDARIDEPEEDAEDEDEDGDDDVACAVVVAAHRQQPRPSS
jgi:hypothetical protein